MPCVALDPFPGDRVALRRCVQALPEVHILHGLLRGCFPTVALPIRHPAFDAIKHIFTVRRKGYVAGSGQSFECCNAGHKLHTVIRGLSFAA